MVEPLKQKIFQFHIGGALRIRRETKESTAQPTAPHFHTSRPLKMEGKAKRPIATPP